MIWLYCCSLQFLHYIYFFIKDGLLDFFLSNINFYLLVCINGDKFSILCFSDYLIKYRLYLAFGEIYEISWLYFFLCFDSYNARINFCSGFGYLWSLDCWCTSWTPFKKKILFSTDYFPKQPNFVKVYYKARKNNQMWDSHLLWYYTSRSFQQTRRWWANKSID